MSVLLHIYYETTFLLYVDIQVFQKYTCNNKMSGLFNKENSTGNFGGGRYTTIICSWGQEIFTGIFPRYKKRAVKAF